MLKKYFLCFFLLSWVLPFVAYSQSEAPDFALERILIHTDRSLYVCGETIWFKLYVFDWRQKQLSDFSNVGYLELITWEGAAVSRVKVALDKGSGSGTLELPPSLNNGCYTLRAYTQAMRNGEEENFGESSLLILNPNQPIVRAAKDRPDAYKKFEPTEQSMLVEADQYLDISVRPSQDSYSQRAGAALEITTKGADGRPVAARLSLSVSLPPPGLKNKGGLFQEKTSNTPVLPPLKPNKIAYLPETYGMRLSGSAINQSTNRGEAEAIVYLAFPGKTALVYSAETDEAGRFSFVLPKLFGLRQVVLQAQPKNEAIVAIELDEAFHEIKAGETTPFVLPPDWQSLANTALVRAQVGQAYQAFELPPVYTAESPFAEIPVFGKADAQYFLDDYTRFPLPEFFYEVAPEVRVKGKFGEERLEVLNEWINYNQEIPPLLLVDGVPVFDQRKFLKINNKLIESAEVVTAPFWLNPGVFDGVVQISSFDGDARCFTLPETALRRSYLTLLPQRQFITPDYTDQADNRLPDFRNTLYWNPSIQTDAEGKARVQFFTSDAIGTYEIRIEGVSDRGLAGTGKGRIQVIKNEE